jgi:hypothetical protein
VLTTKIRIVAGAVVTLATQHTQMAVLRLGSARLSIACGGSQASSNGNRAMDGLDTMETATHHHIMFACLELHAPHDAYPEV